MTVRSPSFDSCLALFALLMASCSHPATAIVVAVDSNLAVPGELAVVHVEVGGAGCGDSTCVHDFALTGPDAITLPFSFTVTPQGDAGPLALVLRGRDAAGSDRVVREVSSSFIAGRTLLLQVELDRACLDAAACASGSTCIAGACASVAIDPTHLVDVVPGTELRFDASTTSDAGIDAGLDASSDVGLRVDGGDDGGTDGGSDSAADAASSPRSCADLPSGAASGAYTIDPDGAGSEPAFLDYCETSADGGGWTLIAKVDPRTTTLSFSSGWWTAASSTGTSTADLSVGDALYPSYWLLPVHELRIVMAPVATPTVSTSLVTAFMTVPPMTLHTAMTAGPAQALTATETDWQRLVGGTPPGTAVCEVSAVPAELPATAPMIRVRIGYVGDDTSGCTSPGFWAGVGADGASCRAVGNSAGGGRVCGPPGQRRDYPLAAWVFGR